MSSKISLPTIIFMNSDWARMILCAQILSGAMMLRYSFGENEAAAAIEAAVEKAVTGGTRTGDIAFGLDSVGTKEMAAAVLANL